MYTPQDIENKVFSSAFMGYSREEVNLFLEELVSDYRKLTEENASLLKKLGILVEKVDEYRKDEHYLREAIVNAQKISEASTMEAEQRARKIVEEAEAKAAELLQTARDERDAIITEAEQEAKRIIDEANEKAEKLCAYSEEALARSRERFNALQREVSEFRTSLFNKYREHIEFIKDLPIFEEPEEDGQVQPAPAPEASPDADTVPADADSARQQSLFEEAPPKAEHEAKPAEDAGPAAEADARTPDAPVSKPDEAEKEKEKERPKSRFENIKFGIDYDISAE